jgi:hypothetical protein
MLTAIIGYRSHCLVYIVNRRCPIHDSTIQRLYDYVPSVRGLSPPAMDSRMEVSAWTFFIR